MTEIDPTKRTKRATPRLAAASHLDASEDPLEGRTLYVLGFGIAGAILTNATLLVYVVSLYASG
jgi:hypothetical protein